MAKVMTVTIVVPEGDGSLDMRCARALEWAAGALYREGVSDEGTRRLDNGPLRAHVSVFDLDDDLIHPGEGI